MTQEKRTTFLLATLLILMAFYFVGKPMLEKYKYQQSRKQAQLEGENEILDIRVIKSFKKNTQGLDLSDRKNNLEIEVDYFYNGKFENPPDLILNIGIKEAYRGSNKLSGGKRVSIGKHTEKISIYRPMHDRTIVMDGITAMMSNEYEKVKTGDFYERISIVEMKKPYAAYIYSLRLNVEEEVNDSNIDALYDKAVTLIDMEKKNSLDAAKKILDKIILFKFDYTNAYHDIARYHMRIDRGDKGHSNAEKMLDVALKIDDDHTDSLILLGHVYEKQKRYKEAKSIFKKVSKVKTDNLWLNNHLGKLAIAEGKKDIAMKFYLRSVNADRPHNKYDRAQSNAYYELNVLYKKSKNYLAMDQLNFKERKEYPEYSCSMLKHGEPKLLLGKLDEGLDLISEGLKYNCYKSYQLHGKKILSFIYLMKWANLEENSKKAEKMQMLSKAQVLYSNLPDTFLYLASHEITLKVVPKLIKEGFDINSTDSQGRTAMQMAIWEKNVNAVIELLENGADVNKLIGEQQWSPLMMAVMTKDINMVKVILGAGVDASVKNEYGLDAESLAKELGLKKIARLVGSSIGV